MTRRIGWSVILLAVGWVGLYLQNSLLAVLTAAALFGYLLGRDEE